MGLAQTLREGTMTVHHEAEGSGFVRCFMKGVLDRATYARHLEALYGVYSAMEAGLDLHKDHLVLKHLYFPEVHRKANLEKDLAYFYGTAWQQTLAAPTPAATAYVQRIREVAASAPYLLAAHAYVRYLGDLSGGQALKVKAAETLDLDAEHGLAFYDFAGIASKREFKDQYRQALNDLPLSEEEQQQVLAEAIEVFRHNGRVFDDLENELIENVGRERYESAVRA